MSSLRKMCSANSSAPVPGAWTNSVHETETVSFRRSRGEIEGPITAGAAGYVRTDRSAHVITVYVYNKQLEELDENIKNKRPEYDKISLLHDIARPYVTKFTR